MGWYTCSDCDYMDLTDKNAYGDAYCSYRRKYYPISDTACNRFEMKGKYIGGPGLCYITTAICDVLGKDDKCYTLETLRSLRDNYMKKQVDCYSMLKEYDVVGPLIAQAIFYDPDNYLTCQAINTCYIEHAVDMIEKGLNEEAIDIYINMTNFLRDFYNIKESYNEDDVSKEIDNFIRKKTINK